MASLAKSQEEKNSLRFLLTLAEDFKRHKEDDEFHPRWSTDEKLASACHETLRALHKDLEGKEPVEEREMKAKLASIAQNTEAGAIGQDAVDSWLSVSKLVSKNQKAYQFLSSSIQTFIEPVDLTKTMKETGFQNIRVKPLTMGAATIFLGEK